MKKTVFGLMGVAVVLAVTACGSQSTTAPATENQVTEVQETTAESTDETEITIEHSKGSTTVVASPQKSVVFDMGILDIMDALEVDTELAVPIGSVTSYLSEYESAVDAGGIKEPNIEAIFEFEPDVIFISGRQEDYYDELSEIAPTIYVDLDTETYLDDFIANVTNIGAIYGKEDEAAQRLADIQKTIDEGKAKAAESDAKALIVLTNDGSMSAYGRGSRFGIIHDVLGIKTVDESIDVSTHGQEASYEYIAEVNPDILFVVDRTAVVGGTQMAGSTLDNELVQSTNAAKNEKIIYLDAETWYLAGGGLTAVETMINEAVAALD